MIPVIDLQSNDVLERIDEAYTTVGFAVFTNALDEADSSKMSRWHAKMQEFFALPAETKKQYP
jgi:isopenicillin N synthase-like dioxygenase